MFIHQSSGPERDDQLTFASMRGLYVTHGSYRRHERYRARKRGAPNMAAAR
jgi:hypothetical protein